MAHRNEQVELPIEEWRNALGIHVRAVAEAFEAAWRVADSARDFYTDTGIIGGAENPNVVYPIAIRNEISELVTEMGTLMTRAGDLERTFKFFGVLEGRTEQ